MPKEKTKQKNSEKLFTDWNPTRRQSKTRRGGSAAGNSGAAKKKRYKVLKANAVAWKKDEVSPPETKRRKRVAPHGTEEKVRQGQGSQRKKQQKGNLVQLTVRLTRWTHRLLQRRAEERGVSIARVIEHDAKQLEFAFRREARKTRGEKK